jgi:FkbM family methyltransferase
MSFPEPTLSNSNPTSDLIFDVGAHKGQDSDFYLKLGYRVVAIEANPILAADLRKRFSDEIRVGRYTLIENAIGETDQKITFYINKKYSVWSTSDPRWADRNRRMGAESEEITVQSIRFLDILKTYGCPHYLKIDIEGADMLCVDALFEIECRPKYLSIESTKTSWMGLLNEFNSLERLGFTRFKVIDQQCHKDGYFKDRNGNAIDYVFEQGASGPFGESLDGTWLTKNQAIRRYIPIFLLYKTIGDNKPLRKILRRIPKGHRILRRPSWYDTHAMRE